MKPLSTLPILITLLTFMLILLGCTGATEAPASDVLITLERTACRGTCPVYTLTISGDGTVLYEGIDFVEVMGQRTSTLSQDQIQELILAFEQADFFSLRDYTEQTYTDTASVLTSIMLNGQTKTVNHYLGDANAPQALIDLEIKIDEITNSKQWTGE